MTEPDFSHLTALHELGEDSIPQIIVTLAGDRPADLVWRSELGGLTFRLDNQFVKWNPRHTGIDLEPERDHLTWLSNRHVARSTIGGDSGHRHRPASHPCDSDR